MNILNYYLQNYESFDDDKWYKKPKIKLIFQQFLLNENNDIDIFEINNNEDALKMFIWLLEPNLYHENTEYGNLLFIALCFYFEINSISIKGVEEFLKSPLYIFNIDESLKRLINHIRDVKLDGVLSYENRRKFNSGLKMIPITKNI